MLRATMRSLLSRKVRLVLSGLAVVLGVMATSGALILTSTLTTGFDQLFADANANVDVAVTGQKHVQGGEEAGDPVSEPVPAGKVAEVAAVPGVAKAYGEIAVNGARVVGPDGKVIVNQGPPTLGSNWDPQNPLFELRSGQGPRAPDEVAINASLAERGEFQLGQRIEVLTLQPKKAFKLVGIFGYAGGRDTIGGATEVVFTEPVAQELMLGQTGAYSRIVVEAQDGVDAAALRDRVQGALGDGFVVQTGEQAAAEMSQDVQGFVSVLQQVLLGFAGVALFVGIFLILNTFSILVAQRTGELALLRSMGASRRQVIVSVLVEAVAIGLVAATIGLGLGVGVAALLKSLMQSFSGAVLPGPWLVLPWVAVIAAYVVGVVVTVVAAAVPALRASRIAPVTAMQTAATGDKPLVKLTVAGAVATLGGAGLVGAALFADLGDATVWALLGGVLLAFVGVAMLTPVISRPVISVLGRAMSFTTAGKLGRLNSARNPRRTAITAAALMVGIALVTGVAVLAQSLTKSAEQIVATDLQAELVIMGSMGGGPALPPNFDPDVVSAAAGVPGVERAVGLRYDSAQITTGTGSQPQLVGAADVAGLAQVFGMQTKAGSLRTLRPGEVVVSEPYATEHGLSVGRTLRMHTQRGSERQLTVVGVYDSKLLRMPVISEADAVAGFRTDQMNEAYIQLADGADAQAVQRQLDPLVADNPEVSVQDQSDLIESAKSQVDTMVVMLYVLLGLALVIAVLGIVNTLALSVLERTRELGLVRAIGMRRRQVMQMVTVESVVIAVFGALLGVVVGAGLGTAVVRALADEGISELAVPWTSMGAFVGLAVVIGLLAAVLPAVRAARTNVLAAIAYE
jgi:putative ABC transport system permease protein